MSDSLFAEHWSKFVERLGSCNDRLMSELESCWRDLQSLLESQLHQREALSIPTLEQPNLHTFQTARSEVSQKLLHEPVSQWERRRPYQRALMAIETYDRSLEDLVRALPEPVSVNGIQAVSVLDEWVSANWRRRLARFRRNERALPLKAIVSAELRRLSRRRSKIEGQYFLALALAIRSMRKPWEMTRAIIDASALGQPLESREVERQIEQTKSSIQELIKQGENARLRWREWSGVTAQQLAKRILMSVVWYWQGKAFDDKDHRAAHLAHWVSQSRAVETEIRLELALERAEHQVLNLFQRALDSLAVEQTDLLAELDGVIHWLRERIKQKTQEDFPPPKADVVPTSSRLSELEAALKAELETLPQSCETLARFSALPRRRSRLKKLYPRETVYQAFVRTGRQEIAQVLEEIESEHRKIVQQIERAREVVAFGLETVGPEQNPDLQVAHEALQNALSLLEFSRREAPDWRPLADARLARALASVFVEARLILTRHRLGALTYLAQQGLRRAVVLAGRSTVAASAQALRSLYRTLERVVLRFLVSIGWKPAPSAGQVEVITRPFLPEEFTVDLSAKELPALYRHLFRLEPVQDPRFLVGREQEMAAIAQARSLWEAGRPVALIIVGQRGSGKTSLINCAVKRSLDDLEVIRGEFSQRFVTDSQLRGFLAGLIGEDDPVHLERALGQRRRVIMLEELERTFLRQVGHYDAIRGLQRLIAATCSSTFWILAINQVAFRFLDAAVKLGSSFSHRINAATATRDDLRQAILVRHNLSGLRLQLPAPLALQNFANRLKSLVQRETDPETIFFDTLAQESAGVYRTAFDIWLGQVETVQAGVLYMKPLVLPDLSPVIDDLDLDDLFTLVAILQHGSLTPEEHATVFQKSVAASRSQIDELLAREIIERDPGRQGFRVRPEAMRVVREALYRRNLL
jgi:GTPase SAR1 family protein